MNLFVKEWIRWKNVLSVAESGSPAENFTTTRKAVWKKGKAVLWVYPAAKRAYRTPVFMIYSPVNEPFILDLMPGYSAIGSFVDSGFDVYLLDFGTPDQSDRDLSLEQYISGYIQQGARRVLEHSGASDLTLIGYCLGGTLAAIYAAVAKEKIRNLILFSTPVDFEVFPVFDEWANAVKKDSLSLDEVIEKKGILPEQYVETGIRLLTSPIYYSPYLDLVAKADDSDYVLKWKRYNQWTKSCRPLPGAFVKDLIRYFVKDNSLVGGGIVIGGKRADLLAIRSSVLMIASEFDKLVPKSQSEPLMNLVGSQDKTFHLLQSGHVPLAVKNGTLPEPLAEWLPSRSNPLK
ncbi:alpha/beta fold hydrolase [Metabacillus indicus]|uniref:alpha/beta fold hydrolase n=1 Tax=Metabacillus indicus TaxID=246786 RepID=UPI003179DCBC